MYSCLFVFFMWVLMSSMLVELKLGPLYTVMFRNVSSCVSLSCVNLIVG